MNALYTTYIFVFQAHFPLYSEVYNNYVFLTNKSTQMSHVNKYFVLFQMTIIRKTISINFTCK